MADAEKQRKKFEKQAEMLKQNLLLRKKQLEDRARLAAKESQEEKDGRPFEEEKAAN